MELLHGFVKAWVIIWTFAGVYLTVSGMCKLISNNILRPIIKDEFSKLSGSAEAEKAER